MRNTHSDNSQNGNAFLYVLIAVIMFAALMFAISRSGDQGSGTTELDDGRVKVSANEILAYSASVSNSIIQMEASGAQPSDIDFIMPFEATFNDPPTLNKLFHPDGGGLNYKTLPTNANADDAAGLDAGYYVGRLNSVEWTPSTTADILFVAYEISTPVCEEINLKLRGDATVPTIGGDSLENLFIDDRLHAGTNADFNVVNCAACEEVPAMCVQNAAGKKLFYSILEAE